MIQRIIDFLLRKTQNGKNIYIVTTSFGLVFVGITFSIFLIALTYTNNVTLIIAFWLLTVFLIQMLKTHKEIKRLNILEFKINNSYADEILSQSTVLSLKPLTSQMKILVSKDYRDLETSNKITRGVYNITRLRIENLGNFSLFYCWKFYQTQKELVIYPKRVVYNIEALLSESQTKSQTSDDEFGLHIPYEQSLSAKRINWRIYAKNQQLYWKKFESQNYTPQELSLNSVQGELEIKIQKLAFLIAFYNKSNIPWSLNLPALKIPTSKGTEHLFTCLKELAKL
jgi:uncharacterized protein (DUF58 family)